VGGKAGSPDSPETPIIRSFSAKNGANAVKIQNLDRRIVVINGIILGPGANVGAR
jgi:hypothetical protein